MDILLWQDLCKTNELPDIYMFAPVNSYTLETFPEVELSPPFLSQPSYSCHLVSLLIPKSVFYFLRHHMAKQLAPIDINTARDHRKGFRGAPAASSLENTFYTLSCPRGNIGSVNCEGTSTGAKFRPGCQQMQRTS